MIVENIGLIIVSTKIKRDKDVSKIVFMLLCFMVSVRRLEIRSSRLIFSATGMIYQQSFLFINRPRQKLDSFFHKVYLRSLKKKPHFFSGINNFSFT